MNEKCLTYMTATLFLLSSWVEIHTLYAQQTYLSSEPKFKHLLREPNLETVRTSLPTLLEQFKPMYGNDTFYEAFTGICRFAETSTSDDWKKANEIARFNDELSALGRARKNVKRVNGSIVNIERAELLFGPRNAAVLYMKYMTAGQCIRLRVLGYDKHLDIANRYLKDVLVCEEHSHTMINLSARYLLAYLSYGQGDYLVVRQILEGAIIDWEFRKLPGNYGVSLDTKMLLAEALIEMRDFSAAIRILSSVDRLEKSVLDKEGREKYWSELARRDIAYAKICLSEGKNDSAVFLLRKSLNATTERVDGDLIVGVEILEKLVHLFKFLALEADMTEALTTKGKFLSQYDLSE